MMTITIKNALPATIFSNTNLHTTMKNATLLGLLLIFTILSGCGSKKQRASENPYDSADKPAPTIEEVLALKPFVYSSDARFDSTTTTGGTSYTFSFTMLDEELVIGKSLDLVKEVQKNFSKRFYDDKLFTKFREARTAKKPIHFHIYDKNGLIITNLSFQ
jgi:hypothetical protein